MSTSHRTTLPCWFCRMNGTMLSHPGHLYMEDLLIALPILSLVTTDLIITRYDYIPSKQGSDSPPRWQWSAFEVAPSISGSPMFFSQSLTESCRFVGIFNVLTIGQLRLHHSSLDEQLTSLEAILLKLSVFVSVADVEDFRSQLPSWWQSLLVVFNCAW